MPDEPRERPARAGEDHGSAPTLAGEDPASAPTLDAAERAPSALEGDREIAPRTRSTERSLSPLGPTAATAGEPRSSAARAKARASQLSVPSHVDASPLGPSELGSVARYLPGAVIGAGGMGEVRLDRDRRIGREVAVKRLHPHLSTRGESQTRFLREARVQGQLEHPSIVPVYDLGAGDDGELYFTMKRVRGRTLSEILQALAEGDAETARRFGRRRLLSAFSQVCLAIDYAHARGVVHRDLKPSNVMLGDWGEVYVLDWGLARVMGTSEEASEDEKPISLEPSGPGASPTRQGALLGTPGYMSPEQAHGAADRVDARSDVFALGAILYELLAPAPMIPRSQPLQMAAATAFGRFTPPSSIASDVPPELEALWAKAVEPDPSARLSSARALSEEVERFLDGDRDREMRRARAEEHAQRAQAEAERAFAEDDLEARRRAAREAGSALALDADQALARETLHELLTRPPERMPEEARARFDAEERERQRGAYKGHVTSTLFYLMVMLALAPLLELRSLWPLAAAAAAMVASAAYAAYARGVVDPTAARRVLGVQVLTTLVVVPVMTFFSPLLAMPVLLAMSTLITSLFPGRAPRWAIAICGTAAPLAYGLADLSGLVPSSVALVGGALHVHPPALGAMEPWHLYTIFFISMLAPALAVHLVGQINTQAEAARRALHVSRWQLAQILPLS